MAYTMDVPISIEQLTKIRKLLEKHKVLYERESSDNRNEQLKEHGMEEN